MSVFCITCLEVWLRYCLFSSYEEIAKEHNTMSNYRNHLNNSDLGVTVKEVIQKKNQPPVPLPIV